MVENRAKKLKQRIFFIVSLSALAALYNTGFKPTNVLLAMVLVPVLTWLIFQIWKPREKRNPVVVDLGEFSLYYKIRERLVKECLDNYETMRLVFEWGFNRDDFEDLAGHIAVAAKGIVEEAGRDLSEDQQFIDLLLEVVRDGNVVSKYHEYKESGKSKEKQAELFRSIADAIVDVMGSAKGIAYVAEALGRRGEVAE